MTRSIKADLTAYKLSLEKLKRWFVSMPANLKYDYHDLNPFLRYSINNIGDPFARSSYPLQAMQFEREVLAYFAKLYELEPDEYWGYITTGGTEGNIYGLYVARETYPNAKMYFSEDSHYSIHKSTHILQLDAEIIPSLQNGEIDYDIFGEKLKRFNDRPAIINLTVGTTMKGAIDNIDRIEKLLKTQSITDYFIHVDAALAGMVLPFLPNAPYVDFRKPIHSIAISGHKFIGCPFPCGIVLVRKATLQKVKERVDQDVEYIGSIDRTITGSRNGLAALYLWHAIQMREKKFPKEAQQCVQLANYLHDKLKEAGYESYHNDYSQVVYFARPPKEIVEKWALSVQKDISHIVCMQHVTKKTIDAFLKDLLK